MKPLIYESEHKRERESRPEGGRTNSINARSVIGKWMVRLSKLLDLVDWVRVGMDSLIEWFGCVGLRFGDLSCDK